MSAKLVIDALEKLITVAQNPNDTTPADKAQAANAGTEALNAILEGRATIGPAHPEPETITFINVKGHVNARQLAAMHKHAQAMAIEAGRNPKTICVVACDDLEALSIQPDGTIVDDVVEVVDAAPGFIITFKRDGTIELDPDAPSQAICTRAAIKDLIDRHNTHLGWHRVAAADRDQLKAKLDAADAGQR